MFHSASAPGGIWKLALLMHHKKTGGFCLLLVFWSVLLTDNKTLQFAVQMPLFCVEI